MELKMRKPSVYIRYGSIKMNKIDRAIKRAFGDPFVSFPVASASAIIGREIVNANIPPLTHTIGLLSTVTGAIALTSSLFDSDKGRLEFFFGAFISLTTFEFSKGFNVPTTLTYGIGVGLMVSGLLQLNRNSKNI